jgi:hypothetical protein
MVEDIERGLAERRTRDHEELRRDALAERERQVAQVRDDARRRVAIMERIGETRAGELVALVVARVMGSAPT